MYIYSNLCLFSKGMRSLLCILVTCSVWFFVEGSIVQSKTISNFGDKERFSKNSNRETIGTVRVSKNVVNTVSPFLNTISSVLRLIVGIRSASTQSAELEYLHRLSDSINQRFDEVSRQFSDIKNLIRWTAVQTSYANLEGNIHVVSEQFKLIFEVPSSGINQQKQSFIDCYDQNYHESGNKLFAGFMIDNGVVSQGLIRPAMNYTENNRGQMRVFMFGILKLLLMAANVELGYKVIKGYDNLVPFYSHLWQARIENIQKKIQMIDLELKNTYLTQVYKDIDTFSDNNFRLSNNMFSQNLHKKLSTKYFWRDWLVVTSTHTEDRHDAHSRTCNGVIKSTHRTKDIVVDSVDKEKPFFNLNEVDKLYVSLRTTCSNTARCINIGFGGGIGRYRRRRCEITITESAETIFSWFTDVCNSCRTYSSIGIIGTSKNPVYYAGLTEGNSSRLFVHDLGICEYNVHFFG